MASSSSQHVSELLRSLKKLFDSGVYTDLKIVCGNDQHQVHKAIVCLRSGRLAQMCSEIGPNQEATITIPDDDPQTIDLMLQYLYTLEYQPRLVPSTTATTKPLTNGINGHHHKDDAATPSPKTAATTNGGALTAATNGNQQQQLPLQQKQPQQQPVAAPPATTLEYSIERETFEAVPAADAAAKLSKKAAKKKKRGSTDTTNTTTTAAAEQMTAPTTTSTSTATAATATTTTTANAAAQTVPPAAIPNNKAAANEPAAVPQKPQHALLQHAKLYTLAHKYAVPGLRALSASRFAAEAEEHWSSDDFLAAAVEAYNTATPKPTDTTAATTKPAIKNGIDKGNEGIEEEGEEEIKPKQSIRDVVLSNMKAHPELLDRAAVQEAIRVHAELSFDLMMYFRETQNAGGSASSVVSY